MEHDNITDIYTYEGIFHELGERILQECPALQRFEDPLSPRIKQLLRRPFPDHPFGLGTIYGERRDSDGLWEKFVIARPKDLPDDRLYSKKEN